MEFEALVVAAAIIIAALTRLTYHVRPKKAFAQVSVGGVTDSDGEAFQATLTFFPEQSEEEMKEHLLKVYALREWRLKMQNERMQELYKKSQEVLEDAKAHGNVTPIKN